MLAVERTALHHQLHAQRLNLQQQDLDRVTTFLESLGTQAALLAGFAFSVFAGLPDTVHEAWQGFFYLSAMLTLGAHLYVVCIGQLTSILGPLLALKGPEGSLERAIEQMKHERGRLFYFFTLGLVGFFMMTVSLVWIHIATTWLAVCCTVLGTLFFALIGHRVQRIVARFKFVEPELPEIVLEDREFEPRKAGGSSGGGAAAMSGVGGHDADAAAVAGASLDEGEVVLSAKDYLELSVPNAGKFKEEGGGE